MGLYKEEQGDAHHLPLQQGPIQQQLHHPRPASIAHPQSHPNSPHQNQNPASFPSPHSSTHSLPHQHRSPYPQQAEPNGHLPQEVYYTSNPYGPPVSGHFSAPEGDEMMAAAQMQRPYQQPVYHTPQSNSPASVASSQSHEQHSRMYAQPPPQMQQAMYGFPQYGPNQSAYPQHPGHQQPPQHQMMNSQPLLSHHGQPPMPQPSPAQPPNINSPRPQPKLEPGIPRPMDPGALQRSPVGTMHPNHSTPTAPTQNGNTFHAGQQGSPGINPNAAPGPIPATTPLVVRQDNNGVQWIAFEYSRDRVKMEYQIRCDVESVNTDHLPADFRTDNCVYPRACQGKDSYKGNRLQYEMECNTVGWALANLNESLRGKRGLIQRAVDSWRNSNQDPRLRSRRVRRQNKMTTRKSGAASHPPNHKAGPRDVGAVDANPMVAPVQQRPAPSNISMAGQAQLHHHHAHPDGSQPGSKDDVSVHGDFHHQRQQIKTPSTPIRPSNVFYANYPLPPNSAGVSMPPQMHNGMGGLPDHVAVSASTGIPTALPTKREASSSPEMEHSDLLANLPSNKKPRKYVVVNDTENANKGVRIKFDLKDVNLADVPDSYRERNSVFPRSWYPVQMQLSPGEKSERRGRFVRCRDDDAEEGDGGRGEGLHVGSVMVKVPMLEGREGGLKVPGLGRRVREREEAFNELGYRISWNGTRVMDTRVVFLQRCLDSYRNKMKENFVAHGQEVSTVAPLFETRVGKRMHLERKLRARGKRSSP